MSDLAVHDAPAAHGGDHHPGAHYTSTGLSNNKLAMWLFLGSECLLFGGLIGTFVSQGSSIFPNTPQQTRELTWGVSTVVVSFMVVAGLK